MQNEQLPPFLGRSRGPKVFVRLDVCDELQDAFADLVETEFRGDPGRALQCILGSSLAADALGLRGRGKPTIGFREPSVSI